MRAWDREDYDASGEYDRMRLLFPACWACGASRGPSWWYAPWLIERAHIANKPRRLDRRLVVMLCSVCHKRSHGERFAAALDWPVLSVAEMLWLKRRCDPDWWDPEFVGRHSVRRLPEPEFPSAMAAINPRLRDER